MARPCVAVATDTVEFAGTEWFATQRQYVMAAARAAGVTPLLVPNLGKDLDCEAVLDAVDGLLLTGSVSNVYPALYGGEVSPANEPYDPARDATSFALLELALKRGMPLLAICRGLQELNVARGGTLQTEIQSIDGNLDHRAPQSPDRAERFAVKHSIRATPGSHLAGLIGDEPVMVNSLHRQAIARPGSGIVVEAAAGDGIAEAVSVQDARSFAMGVQWHPEFAAENDPVSQKLFRAFGDDVRAHAARRFPEQEAIQAKA